MSLNALKIKLYALRLSKSEKTIHQSCAALAASAIVCSFSGIHQLQQISNSTKSAIQQIHQISKSAIKAIPQFHQIKAIQQIHQISNSAIKAIKAFPKTDHSIH